MYIRVRRGTDVIVRLTGGVETAYAPREYEGGGRYLPHLSMEARQAMFETIVKNTRSEKKRHDMV